MDKSHRSTIQKEKVLGEVPPVKKKKQKAKFKKGQEVYLSAFLKEEKGVFYICKGIVEEVPGPNERQIYKVKITAVADRAIGGPKIVRQARLLGLVCSKRARELNDQLANFMVPESWIDKAPKDQRYRKRSKHKAKKENSET